MKKYTFQAVRAGFVLGAALFVATGTVFASATILSTQTTDITDTSAVLNSQFDNPGMNSYVHFEWGYGSSFPSNTAGTQSFSVGSAFKTTLEGLTPDTAYSYRAVVVARPVTGGSALPPVYSPVVYFKTLPFKSAVSNTSSQTTSGSTQNNSNNTNQTTAKNTTTNTNTSVTKNSNTNSATNTDKSSQGFTNTKDGFTNNSGAGASVIGSGAGILPTTLTGWVILLIALFILLLIVRLIYEQSEKRKKALAAKKAAEAALAEAKKNQLATA